MQRVFLDMHNSEIADSDFLNQNLKAHFVHNEFIDVKFENVFILSESRVFKNHFKNCVFENIKFSKIEDIEDFITHNTFDPKIEENYITEEEEEVVDELGMKYYIFSYPLT